MLEFYQAYADYHDLMDLTEAMLHQLGQKFGDGGKLEYEGREIDLSRQFRRVTVADAILEHNPGLTQRRCVIAPNCQLMPTRLTFRCWKITVPARSR